MLLLPVPDSFGQQAMRVEATLKEFDGVDHACDPTWYVVEKRVLCAHSKEVC